MAKLETIDREKELLLKVASGDKEAFGQLYDFYAPLIVCRDLLVELNIIIRKISKLPKKAFSEKSISMYRVYAICNALRRIGHASYIEKIRILKPQSKRIKQI